MKVKHKIQKDGIVHIFEGISGIKEIIKKVLLKPVNKMEKEFFSKAKLKVLLGTVPDREKKKDILYIDNNIHADINWDTSMSLPLPPDSVSEIDAVAKLMYSNNAPALMNEIHRVLKNGGKVSFNVDKGKKIIPPQNKDYSEWNANTLAFYINDDLRRAQSIYPKFSLISTQELDNYSINVQMKKVKSGIMKSEDEVQIEEPIEKNTKFVEIIKVDDDKQIMTGVVFQPEVEDSDGDVASAEEIEKGMHEFMRSKPIFDVEHNQNIEDGVQLVENYLAPTDLVFKNNKKEQKVKKGSWIMSVKVADELWEEVKKGKINGFSPWGTALREHDIEEGDNE